MTIAGSNATQDLFHIYDPATDRLIETYAGNSFKPFSTTDIFYGYDALGRLASVTENRINGAYTTTDTLGSHNMYSANGSITTTNLPNTVYSYDAAGNLHSEALPDGITQTYGYDTLNRLTSETVTDGSTTIATFTYTLSADGKRTNSSEAQFTTSGSPFSTTTITWGYDGDNRLTSENYSTSVSGESYTDTYTYDNVGNRLTKTHVVGTNTLSITDTYDSNGDDRLVTETATGTGAYSTSFSYDNNGSLILETRTGSGAVTSNYTYDVQNHLTTAVVGATTTTYAYDADGNRVSSTQGSTTTYYTIDGINPTGYTQILEQATSFGGTPTTTYETGVGVLGQANSSGVLSYFVTDGHSSTRILADASGNITSRYDYDAYGNALTSTSGTQILYSGQLLDSATGLYNLRARNYDPTTGRFTSFDSFLGNRFDPTSLPRFLYGGDNPISNIDPTGRQLSDILVATGIDSLLSGLEFTVFSATANVVQGVEAGESANQVLLNFIINQAVQVGTVFGLSLLGKIAGGLHAGSLFASLAGEGESGVVAPATEVSEVEAEAEQQEQILFGQKRISNEFGDGPNVPSYLKNRTIDDVAADLKSGKITPDQIQISCVRDPATGKLVTLNNRGLAALSDAGFKPTNVVEVPYSAKIQDLLDQRITNDSPIIDSPLPGPSIPITPSQEDLEVVRVISLPGEIL